MGYAIVEIFLDILAVTALRCGREAKEFTWLQVVQNCAVGRSFGVVELINDDDLKMVRCNLGQALAMQRLDAREDMVPLGRLFTAEEELAKAGSAKNLAVRPLGLGENLTPVGNEKQPWPSPQLLAKAAVVQCGHDRLACTGGGNEEVAVTIVNFALGL